MEQEAILGTTIVGKDFKALIGRHCMRDLVFYSIELLNNEQHKGYHFMVFDRGIGKYQFVPAPNEIPTCLMDRTEEFSAYIIEHFHSHCLS